MRHRLLAVAIAATSVVLVGCSGAADEPAPTATPAAPKPSPSASSAAPQPSAPQPSPSAAATPPGGGAAASSPSSAAAFDELEKFLRDVTGDDDLQLESPDVSGLSDAELTTVALQSAWDAVPEQQRDELCAAADAVGAETVVDLLTAEAQDRGYDTTFLDSDAASAFVARACT